MSARDETKAIVTVAEMARMCGLSRSRFYQLIGTVFPFPVHDIVTRRPHYTEQQQALCLEVRRRNRGIDGNPVMFYSRRQPIAVVKVKTARTKATTSTKRTDERLVNLIAGLKALGLADVSPSQIEKALKERFPQSGTDTDEAEVLRAIFIHLKRQKSGDTVR